VAADGEKKKLNVVQLIAVSFASVASMCIGSAFGIRGTYIGTGIGTLISGVIAFVIEKFSLRTHDKIRQQVSHLTASDEDATSMFPAIKVKRSQRPWLLTGIAAGMALISAAIALGIFGIVRGATGTTLGNYTPERPQVVPTVTETPTDIVTPTFTESPPESFSAPSEAPFTPTPTVTVTATSTLTPSPTADSTPTALPSSPSPSTTTTAPLGGN
jgi:hypothetical protein